MSAEDAVDFSCSSCWVCCESSGKGIGDRSFSGQPAVAAMMETDIKFNGMIQGDCCITTSELCAKIGIGKFVMAIDKGKVCQTQLFIGNL